MNNEILYRISNNGKNEFIDTNDKTIEKIIEEAENYYKLPIKSIRGVKIVKSFNLGEFLCYFLKEERNIDTITNKKVLLLRKFFNQYAKNNKNYNANIFLSFVKNILKIPSLPFCTIFVTEKYQDEDIKLINEDNFLIQLETLKNNHKNIKVCKEYICKDIIELLIVSFYEIIITKSEVKKCINCKRIFLRNSNCSNVRYCNYSSPQNPKKSCNEFRKNAKYQDIRKSNKIYEWHNTIYDMLSRRKERLESKYENIDNNNINLQKARNDLKAFKKFYVQETAKFDSGEITQDEFINKMKILHIKYKEEKNVRSRNNKK